MRSLRRKLEAQLDTPWVLLSRRKLIADELYVHLDDHMACLEEDEGLPRNAAAAEAWAAFGDLKAVAGEFLAQHRLEAYALYLAYVFLFAAILWPLPNLINTWLTGFAWASGSPLALDSAFNLNAMGHRLLVTWELFWLFVLVRTAHCTAATPLRRWTVIGLLFPGYILLGVLGPYVLSVVFAGSLQAPWLAWFNQEWIQGWMTVIQDPMNQPSWVIQDPNMAAGFVVANIIGLYLIRAYVVEGCWGGRDWPRLLMMTMLLMVGLSLLFDAPVVERLVYIASHVGAWSEASSADKIAAFGLTVFRQMLLVGYFVGCLRAVDAAYGYVLEMRERGVRHPLWVHS